MAQDIHAAALADIRREIADLEQKLAEAKGAESYHAARIPESPEHIHLPVKKPSPERQAGIGNPFEGMKQFEAARAVLKAEGKPMKTVAIAQKMFEGGFPAQSMKTMTISLYTTLTRKKDEFKKVDAGTWGLADW